MAHELYQLRKNLLGSQPSSSPTDLQEAAARQALVQRQEARGSRPLLLLLLLLPVLLLLVSRWRLRALLLLPAVLLLRLLRLLLPRSRAIMHHQRSKLGVQVGGKPVGGAQRMQQLCRRRAAQRVVRNLSRGWRVAKEGKGFSTCKALPILQAPSMPPVHSAATPCGSTAGPCSPPGAGSSCAAVGG